jgi:hypothetical protein
MLRKWIPSLLYVAALVAALAAFAGTGYAAPGGNGKGQSDPNVSVSPSPAHVGDSLVFSGCGYAAASGVTVVINSPFAVSFTGATTDGSGCFSTSGWGYTARTAGSYTVNVYQPTDHHNPSGSLTFTVN